MLTRLELLTYALDQSQLDSSYLPQARLWLNHFIEKQARNFDWPWFRTQMTDVNLVPGTNSYTLPTNYSRSDTLYLFQINNSGVLQKVNQIQIVSPSIFDQYAVTNPGYPNVAYVQTANPIFSGANEVKTLVFNQVSNNTNLYFRLNYFRRPVFLATTGAQATTDDALIPDFEDQDMLVQEMIKVAMQNIDDERFPVQAQVAKAAERDAKINSNDMDDDSVVELATSTFKHRRGRRYGSWMGD